MYTDIHAYTHIHTKEMYNSAAPLVHTSTTAHTHTQKAFFSSFHTYYKWRLKNIYICAMCANIHAHSHVYIKKKKKSHTCYVTVEPAPVTAERFYAWMSSWWKWTVQDWLTSGLRVGEDEVKAAEANAVATEFDMVLIPTMPVGFPTIWPKVKMKSPRLF